MSREQGRVEVRTERHCRGKKERHRVRRVAALSRPLRGQKGSPGRGHSEAKKEHAKMRLVKARGGKETAELLAVIWTRSPDRDEK